MTNIDLNASSTARNIFKKSTLAVCIATLTAQAYAQEAKPAAAPVALEEVVVYGIRQSLQNAQDVKREAPTVKDVITASDISALPDKSVVESLSRVPGVSIERFASSEDPDHFSVESSSAVVRGLARARSEFNGRDTFSANRSSGLNYSDVPAELMSSVEVVKNTTADMIEGGIAGTINLKTRKPFDSKERVLGATLKATNGDMIGGVKPDISGVFSDRWDTDIGELGFLVNASQSSFTARSEGVGVYPHYERSENAYQLDANGKRIPQCPEWAGTGGNCIDTNNDGAVDSYVWGAPLEPARDPLSGVGVPLEGAAPGAKYYMPAGAVLRSQDNDRDRTGFASSVQWKNPNETIEVTAEFIHSKSELVMLEHFIENPDEPFVVASFSNSTFVKDPNNSQRSSLGSSFDSNGWFTNGIIGNNKYVTGTRQREDNSQIDDTSINVKFTPNEKLTITGDLQYIKASSDATDFTIHAINTDAGDNALHPNVYLDLRGSEPYVEFSPRTFSPSAMQATDNKIPQAPLGSFDPWATVIRSAMDHVEDNSGDATAVQADVEYAFENSWIKSVKGGFRSGDKTQNRKDSAYNWGNISQEWDAGSRATFGEYPSFGETFSFGSNFGAGSSVGTADNYVTALTPEGTSRGANGTDTFLFPKVSLLNDIQGFSDTIQANGIHNKGGADMWYPLADKRRNRTGAANDPIPGTPFLPSEIFEVEEKRSALYGMVNFENDDLPMEVRGNVGLRYVDMTLTSVGALVVKPADAKYTNPANWVNNTINIPANVLALMKESSVTPSTKESNFNKLLPSFNMSVGVADDLIVRFAASQSIWLPDLEKALNDTNLSQDPHIATTRPDLAAPQYAESKSFNYRADEVGNPLLKPEVSVNLDLSAEWYFASVGSLTFSLFDKSITDLHRLVEQVGDYKGQKVFFSTTDNVGDATIRGFELAYQQTFDFLPEPFNGVGTQANYTYIDAKQTTNSVAASQNIKESFRYFDNLPLEGLSKDTANLVLFYENDSISTRLAYNWRSDYLLNSRDVISYSPIYNMANGQLDYSFRYNLTDSIKVGFEANNLLNEVTRTRIQFDQEGTTTPRNFFVNDRRYTLVLSASL